MDTVDGKQLQVMDHWTCERGHVLGVMVSGREKMMLRNRQFNYPTTHLLLFHNAIDLNADVPEDIDVVGVLDSKIMNMIWRCSICSCVTKWHPSKKIVEHMASMYMSE